VLLIVVVAAGFGAAVLVLAFELVKVRHDLPVVVAVRRAGPALSPRIVFFHASCLFLAPKPFFLLFCRQSLVADTDVGVQFLLVRRLVRPFARQLLLFEYFLALSVQRVVFILVLPVGTVVGHGIVRVLGL
jgi:hypothetical protein